MLKTIVGHFLGARDAYMTTELSGINSCIPDRVIVSDYGSSPHGGNFRLVKSDLKNPPLDHVSVGGTTSSVGVNDKFITLNVRVSGS
jgi:hypothetical protein